jgi:hypothetical protein
VKFPRSTRQLHLVFNHEHEIVALKLTPGNVSDPTPVISLVKGLTGKLFGDKGYIGKKLVDTLLRQGLALMTKVRKNMKSLPMTPADIKRDHLRSMGTRSSKSPLLLLENILQPQP